MKQRLKPMIVVGRELAGLVHDAPAGGELYRVKREVADWRKAVYDLLSEHDQTLAEWFSVENHPEYGDDLVGRLLVGYAGGEERLRLLNYMSQRIAKLDRIVAGGINK